MAENEEFIGVSTATPRDSIGSGVVSFSSGSSMSNSGSSSSVSIKTVVNECTSSWINYLNILNSLCTAGTKLSQSIAALEQCGQNPDKTTFRPVCSDRNMPQNAQSNYLTNSWNDLARATTVATSTVKSHIMAVLQDFIVSSTSADPTQQSESEQQRIKDHNQLVIIENAQTIINIQHQFCAASYDAFSTLTCCFVCQAPVGFPHEPDCSMIKQKSQYENRSQTPSPHFGATQRCETNRAGSSSEQRGLAFGSSSSHISNEPVFTGLDQTQSPQSSFRDASPLQGILENIRGPLPNPGRLLAMKVPFYRNAKSPLNFPLFPLNGQRRWSEAAAGEVCNENITDVESQMRRWSMPWEASKTDQNTVTWYQTRMMPMNTVKFTSQKFSSERSTSNTPESPWQSSVTSQDGLAEAIQLLSCRPISNIPQNHPIQQMHSVDVSVLDEQGPSTRRQ